MKNVILLNAIAALTVGMPAFAAETEESSTTTACRKPGPIESPIPDVAGLRISFESEEESQLEEDVDVGIRMDMDKRTAFGGLRMVEPSGRLSRRTPCILARRGHFRMRLQDNQSRPGEGRVVDSGAYGRRAENDSVQGREHRD